MSNALQKLVEPKTKFLPNDKLNLPQYMQAPTDKQKQKRATSKNWFRGELLPM